MKDYVCLYSVEALDLNEETKTHYGFLFANNFVDAVKQLENSLYGKDLIQINEVKLFDTTPELSEEFYHKLETELNDN